MPTNLAGNAAQVIVTPSACPGVNILNSTLAAPLTTATKVLQSGLTAPNNATTFVTQPTSGGTLVFTGPGYVNFYLQTPSNTVSGSGFLRAVGVVFTNDGGTHQTYQALGDIPMNGSSLIPQGDPSLPSGCTSGVQVYNAFVTPVGDTSTWDFYILYQSGDGTVSMIDPDWENENDN